MLTLNEIMRSRNCWLESYKNTIDYIKKIYNKKDVEQQLKYEVRTAIEKKKARKQLKLELEDINNKYKPNRILQMQVKKRKQLAVDLGRSYHQHISNLYTSKYADVEYGDGGNCEVSWKVYAKSYRYPASWCNAGARFEGNILILESSRGTEKARIPIDFNQKPVVNNALIDGDLYAVEKHGVLIRYGWKRKRIVKTGVSVKFPVPKHYPSRLPLADMQTYWEHGKTIKECRKEYEHKCEVAERNYFRQANSIKINKVAKLICRICNNLPVTYDDARSMGYCDIGIRAWCEKHNINPEQGSILANVRGQGWQADQLAHYVVRKCAERMLAQQAYKNLNDSSF